MHNPWEEMIPFYIAGTLPRTDSQRLERHLSGCDECRHSLESWRAIAGVVRAQASGQMRDLPPLSPRVLEQAAQSGRGRRSTMTSAYAAAPEPRRYGSLPVTMIAAVITVVMFGGLLALMVLRGLPAPNATNVGLLPTVTETVSGTPQIIIIEPSASPTNTDTPIPPSRDEYADPADAPAADLPADGHPTRDRHAPVAESAGATAA